MEHKTTMDVRASTLAEFKDLKKNKREINAKSIDDVIKWLLDKHLDQGDADGAAGMEEEEAGGPRKQRKVNIRDPLYSLEILSEREGMLYYLTGFERSEVDLLAKRFGEVRMSVIFFACSTLHAHAPLWCLLF
jgi:hypothetical protein